jgi:hypothetical protein
MASFSVYQNVASSDVSDSAFGYSYIMRATWKPKDLPVGVNSLPQDIKPTNPYDWNSFDGVVIFGDSTGNDGIEQTTFTITAHTNDQIGFESFGGRLKSIAIIGGTQDGSSKLYGEGGFDDQGDPVPEPASAVMIGVGIALVRLTQMRKQYSEV